ncbi:MAG TPA: YciI family protein [Nocardioides sp.]|nr:YciI family protein [Nocardioides sp.]
MTEYVVLLPGDESRWEAASEAERAAVYARHGEFARMLAERGHTVTGGAELTHSRTAKVVRRDGSGITITDGPYAETVEQLSGYYVVESDDLDDLLEVCGILADGDGAVEVRAVVSGGTDGVTDEVTA